MHFFWGMVVLFLQFFLEFPLRHVVVATCREGILEFSDSLNVSGLIVFLVIWHIFHKPPENVLYFVFSPCKPQSLHLYKQSAYLTAKKNSTELIVHVPILWGCALLWLVPLGEKSHCAGWKGQLGQEIALWITSWIVSWHEKMKDSRNSL